MRHSSGSDTSPGGRSAQRRTRYSRSRRGQTEPIAALAAVFAVCVGITLYVGVHAGAMPDRSDRTPAEPAMERTLETIGAEGTVDPRPVANASGGAGTGSGAWMEAVAPPGYEYNVTVAVGTTSWSAGAVAPDGTDRTARRVPVRRAPGRVDPGRIVVEVWT